MKRREFIMFLGGAAAWSVAASAQQRAGVRRLGVLIFGRESDPIARNWVAALQEGLRQAGWIDNSNIAIAVRFAADQSSVQATATELLSLAPDLILAHSSPGATAIRERTKTIPIVFVAVGDPVINRIVKDVAHPEGNVTGITNLFPSMGGKWLELLKEIAPRTA